MKFVSYNIQYGIGLDGKYDLKRIAETIADADIIALQEVTRGFARNEFADMPELIGALLPNHFWVYGAPCDVYLPSANRRFQFGNMVLSRLPILSTRTLLLPRSRTFSRVNLQRGAVEAVIDTPEGAARIYSVHLDHTSPDERMAQIFHLKARIDAFVHEGGSLTGTDEFDIPEPPLPEDYIIMGDFNMIPESPEYCAMAGRVDGYYGRVARVGTAIDALAECGGYEPGSYSWMDPSNEAERMHIDYCFVSPGFANRIKSARVDTVARGSDHFPLFVETKGLSPA